MAVTDARRRVARPSSFRPGRLTRAGLGVLAGAAQPCCAEPPPLPDPRVLFTDAVAADLGTNGRPDPERAFSLYSEAAAAGLAVAQLNTAVLLDSGRGTRHDAARAATYYALAASQGIARAAYDLGQLYADGEGVPTNLGLAHAWLHYAAARGISAALSRMASLPAAPDTAADQPSAPNPVAPAAGAALSRQAGFQFVWTATAQPAATQFFVQVESLDGVPHDVFTAQTELSAVVGTPPPRPGRYAWRVFTICQSLGRYVASPWVPFSVS